MTKLIRRYHFRGMEMIRTSGVSLVWRWIVVSALSIVLGIETQAQNYRLPNEEEEPLALEKMILLTPGKIEVMPSMTAAWKAYDSAARQRVIEKLLTAPPSPPPEVQDVIDYLKGGGVLQEFTLFSIQVLDYFASGDNMSRPMSPRNSRTVYENTQLSDIAKQTRARFVVELPELRIQMSGGDTVMQLHAIIYDTVDGRVVQDGWVEGGMRNPGFEFGCEDGTIECLVNNTTAAFTRMVHSDLGKRDVTVIKSRQLKESRVDVFRNMYRAHGSTYAFELKALNGKYDFKGGVPYFSLVAPDSTKFILFVEELSTVKNEMRPEKHDGETRRISMSMEALKDSTDDVRPVYVTYYGLYDRSEWHSTRSGRSVREPEDIASLRLLEITSALLNTYFVKQTSQHTPAYWETGMFRRVVDLTKDPDFERYRDIYESDARKNRAYIGWYEIAADSDREKKKAAFNTRTQTLTKSKFAPLMKKMPKDWSALESFQEDSALSMITPESMSVWIVPIAGKTASGDTTVRFFLWDEGSKKMYRWNRLQEFKADRLISPSIVDAMKSVSDWNYGYTVYDDDRFWNEDVLAKEGDRFKYLEEMR